MTSADTAAIDDLVWRLCANPAPADAGELKQLRTLFRAPFLAGLEELLQAALDREGSPAHCVVDFGWIDKIPVAEAGALTRRTELGDLVIMAFEEVEDARGRLVQAAARAVLLQAKIAKTAQQVIAPTVPIGSGPSTTNELSLLSAWPRFDLYKAGASKDRLLTGVDLGPSAAPPPHGWFMAAPKAASRKGGGPWPTWWMAGPPLQGAPCDVTFGGILSAFLTGAAAGKQGRSVGDAFRLSGYPSPTPPTDPDWDKLCNVLFRLTASTFAPPSLFPPHHPRRAGVAMPPAALVSDWLDQDAIPRNRRYGARRAPPADATEEEPPMFALLVGVRRTGEPD